MFSLCQKPCCSTGDEFLPDPDPTPSNSEGPCLWESLRAATNAVLDASPLVSTWSARNGPAFGLCGACAGALQEPIVLACGHPVCKTCHEATSGNNSPCRWAPSCRERFFPRSGEDAASIAPAIVSRDLEGLLVHCQSELSAIRCAEAEARPELARSPLEAVLALESAADDLKSQGCRVASTAHLLVAAAIYERFKLSFSPDSELFANEGRQVLGCCPAELCLRLEAETTAESWNGTQNLKAQLEMALSQLPAIGAANEAAAAANELTSQRMLASLQREAAAPASQDGGAALLEDLLTCPACQLIFFEPISLQCGHTLCRECLARQLDFGRGCPLCRQPLADTANRYAASSQLQLAVQSLYPDAVQRAKASLQQQLEDCKTWLPIFVGNLLLPTRSVSVYVEEPHRKCMLRRLFAAGLRRFGVSMAVGWDDYHSENSGACVGTVVLIKQVQKLSDGSWLVEGVGERRYRVLEASKRDGYTVARVDYLPNLDSPELQETRPATLRPAVAQSRVLARQLRDQVQMRVALEKKHRRVHAPESQRDEGVLLGAEAMPEDDLAFAWAMLEALPVSATEKYTALQLQGMGELFATLQLMLEEVLGRVLASVSCASIDSQDEHEGSDSDTDVEEGIAGAP
eukprot:TRINITY_DN106633_c0_g1_i1.p1 TRINITY_DN106633_c0_g1~~TRINITY_DN106633_c0_g1_i1.p1  ORF type:complete len:633 (+),score=104.39 TRINITY_DN106633_c0_g1_i1:51-1949(+)